MQKFKDQRVGVFIDVQNMYHSAKALYNANVNFQEVLKEAVAGRLLIRAIAYTTRSQEGEEEKFFERLEKQGFELKTKDLQVFPGGAKKGDWDVGITVDAIKLADRLDVVVLVTGDGDYEPMVKYLQENKGCKVEVMAFSKSTSSKLIEVADEFYDLIGDLDRFLLKSKKTTRRTRTKKR